MIHFCYPLSNGKSNILSVYELLVLARRVAPKSYVPFAGDPFGNELFVDCSTAAYETYFYEHESGRLHRIGVGFDELWNVLQ